MSASPWDSSADIQYSMKRQRKKALELIARHTQGERFTAAEWNQLA